VNPDPTDPMSRVDSVERLLAMYGAESEESYYDCEGPLENGLCLIRWRGGDPRRARDELAELLTRRLSDDELHRATMPFVARPAGTDMRTFLAYLLRRTDAALATPPPAEDEYGILIGHGMCHRSRFFDRAGAELAARDVLRANEFRLRAWAQDQAGTLRLHLVADLGRTIGTYRPTDLSGRPCGDPVPTSTCAVLMRIDRTSGRPYIGTCYPDALVDPAARERYPDLAALFGGFFGQDLQALDRTYWWAEDTFHGRTGPAVIARITEQLGDLLAAAPPRPADASDMVRDEGSGRYGWRPDTWLRVVVHDLGSCAGPLDMVRWVSGLHRRCVELAWR